MGAPDIAPGPPRPRWWLGAKCAAVGVVVGLIVGGQLAAPHGVFEQSFRDGRWSVPDQITPGLYRSDAAGPTGDVCTWSRLRNLSGDEAATITVGVMTGPSSVEVEAGDRGFETFGGCLWSRVDG